MIFFYLRLLVSAYLTAWRQPPKPAETELDWLTWTTRFFSVCVVAFAFEGLIAIVILQFLSLHGQL